MKKQNRLDLRFALIVGLVLLLPFLFVIAFGGIGVTLGGGTIAGMIRTTQGWDLLFYALLAVTVIAVALFAVLRARRRT